MELSRPVVVQHHGHLTLTLDFQGKILKMLYLGNGRVDWHGTNRMWVNRMLNPLCDFQSSPHPWPWLWIFKVKFWKSHISGMAVFPKPRQHVCFVRRRIQMSDVGFVKIISIWCLSVQFGRRSMKSIREDWNGMADWHRIKGMCVDRMLNPCCDLQCPPHPWPWPWIFKVKFWKCCISGKGCESIGCYTHFVTLTSSMTLTLNFHCQILK